MGPPSAGEGTQAAAVCQRYGLPAISTGDSFRANVLAGTDLGVTAQPYMSAGEYVPDEVTNATVRDRLALSDCVRGFLLDGYPPHLEQVKELDVMLADLDRPPAYVAPCRQHGFPTDAPTKVAEAEAWAIQHWNVIEVGDR